MMCAMWLTSLDPTAVRTGADDLVAWLTSDGLRILVTVIGAVVLRWLLHRSIDRVVSGTVQRAGERDQRLPGRAARVLSAATGPASERRRQRAATMGAILKSTSTFAISAMAILTVMGLLGLPLGPLLASAGVGGVALGFGAQSLVKDFLSGIFMIIEDQYGVGDVIDTGEAIGTVEDVTLRVTRLRDGSGVVWYIRNGEIVRIANRSQGWATAVVDTQVAYDEDIDRAIGVMREVVHQMDQDPAWEGRLLEEPSVVGVESIAAGAVTVRIVAKCAPGEEFPLQRELRERVKVALDRGGVRAPQLLPPYGAGAPRA
jgi:moderate conductance mechanosensitive channel